MSEVEIERLRADAERVPLTDDGDSCHHGKAHIVHDCLRCGAPVCCGKCCADDPVNDFDVAGEIAYQLTKKLVIDMPAARAAVDAAIASATTTATHRSNPTQGAPMPIDIVKSKDPANRPFALQFKNVFGNWCSISAHLTAIEAQRAGELHISQGSNCGRPMRIEHCTGGPINN